MADHKGVITQIMFQIPETATHQREVWHFTEADWKRIANNIEVTNLELLSATFPLEGALRITEELLHIAEEKHPLKICEHQEIHAPLANKVW